LVKHHCWWLNSSFLLGFRRLDPQNLQRPGSWKWPQHPRALKPRGKNPAPGAWEALRPSPGGWGDGRNFQGKIWENDGKMLLFAVFLGWVLFLAWIWVSLESLNGLPEATTILTVLKVTASFFSKINSLHFLNPHFYR
jgi:hypothetical protein